ncbi:Cilia- and flagella-associated protein 20 [Smittium culicis]|uniref:Cilia-and flagella-associated protein 20 n=1 Tax=Smittium culicis TaxID=133412 RepID=A0A1R1Y574_9FUNG|nr:Cilia- and flagella-associated protein 20 [Smittium culicis]
MQLGMKLPFIIFQIRNLNLFFSFELEIIDEHDKPHYLRSSNFQKVTRSSPLITTFPLRLEKGWNLLTLNIAETAKACFGSNYKETSSITINASCHIRRIFFSDKVVAEDSLPPEFKLYFPSD